MLLARMGKDRKDFGKGTRLGKIFRRRGVQDSPDLQRVRYLPARTWEGTTLEDGLTEWLALPKRTCDVSCVCGGAGTMALWPTQAKALEELHDFGGLVAPLGCGAGKTILSLLAPVVLGAERPLLLIPAKLRGKTIREFALLKRHWLSHPGLWLVTYEKLSRDGGFELIQRINPDLVIADECHRVANQKAGCTRKLTRWAKENPACRWALMSGTITNRSLRDYAHLSRWALRDLSPLPLRGDVVAEWSDCLDEKIDPMVRLAPGLLLGLCSEDEIGRVAAAPADIAGAVSITRCAFQRRFVSTPGVVATGESDIPPMSLSVTELTPAPDVMARIEASRAEHYRSLREDWIVPGGEPFTEAVDLWRHAREISVGLCYAWMVPGPPEWLEARREWSGFVRRTLAAHRKGIDTELQVAKAVASGVIPSLEYGAWCRIRNTFKPTTVPRWIDEETLQICSYWLHTENGLCWTEHVFFAERLAEFAGVPYFGQKGLDKHGREIEAHDGPAILSLGSNSEGRNLQHKWSKNLVSSAPPNGKAWEQMLSRCHRHGQPADEVTYEVLLLCREQIAGMEQAIRDSRYVQESTGAARRLLFADKELSGLDDRVGPLWEEA
jgi:hypothetical protein